jgi:hypothetical protein
MKISKSPRGLLIQAAGSYRSRLMAQKRSKNCFKLSLTLYPARLYADL